MPAPRQPRRRRCRAGRHWENATDAYSASIFFNFRGGSGNQSFVVGVRADPKPCHRISFEEPEGAIPAREADRMNRFPGVNAFEPETGVVRIVPPQPVSLSRLFANFAGQRVEMLPKRPRCAGIHSGLDAGSMGSTSPRATSARASSASRARASCDRANVSRHSTSSSNSSRMILATASCSTSESSDTRSKAFSSSFVISRM